MASVDTGTAYSSVRIRLDQLDNDLKGVYSRLDQMEVNIKKYTQESATAAESSFKQINLAGVAAFVGIGVAAKNAVTTFADFDQSMANVSSVAGASALQMDKLKSAAEDAGETTRYTASEAADALYYLASAGFTATQSTQALTGVLQLAQATGSDLATTSSSMAATISQFNLQAEDAGRVSNVFAAAITSSQANMDKLTTGLRQVGPVAGTLGISLEEVTANLDALFNKGFQGEQAGTALRSILLDLVDPSSTVVAALKAQGMAYDDVNPRVVGLTGAINNMQKAGVDLTTVFGKESASEAMALVDVASQATGNLNDLQTAITGTNKAAQAEATQNDTLSGSFDITASKAQQMAIVLSDNAKPAMRLIVDAAGDVFAAISKLPSIVQTIITGFVAATMAVAGLKTAFGALNVAVSGSALGLVFAGISAISTATIALTNHFNDQKNVTEKLNTATIDLEKSSDEYKKVQEQLTSKTTTLTDAEKQLLENRKKLLALEMNKELTALAKTYDKANKETQRQANLVKYSQEVITKYNSDIKNMRDNMTAAGASQEQINKAVQHYTSLNAGTYNRAVKQNASATEQLTKDQTDMLSTINEIAHAVADGSIDISSYANTNKDLYDIIMAQVDQIKAQTTATVDVAKKTDTATASLTKWQEALKKALSVKDVSSGAKAVSEYTSTMAKELEKSISAAKSTGGEISDIYSDYAAKVNKAVEDLIMSGEYVADEKTIKSLQKYADTLSLLEWFYTDMGDAQSTFIDNQDKITLTAKDMQDELSAGLKKLMSGFYDIGEAIGEGSLSWETWGEAGLNALSATLEALGDELSALAIESVVKQLIASLGYAASIPIALAGAAAAYLAAGIASGAASNMATGGIVEPSSGGTIVRVAENDNGEVMFNTGSSGAKFTDQMASAIASKIGGVNSGTQVIQTTFSLNGKALKTFAKEITRIQNNGDY